MVDSGDTDGEELTSVGKWRNEGGDEERKGARHAGKDAGFPTFAPRTIPLFPVLPSAWEADLCRPPRQGSLAAAFWYCLANGIEN